MRPGSAVITRYQLALAIVVVLAMNLISIYASVRIANNQAMKQQRLIAEESARQNEQRRLGACSVYSRLITVLTEDPPKTASGKALLDEYKRQYRIRYCTPALKE